MQTRKISLTLLVILSFLLPACSAASSTSKTATSLVAGNSQAVLAAQATTPSPATSANNNTTTSANAGFLSAFQTTLDNIYTQVNPSVVNIQVVQEASSQQAVPSPFFGGPSSPGSAVPNTPQYSYALGSGFVWDKNGDIVTNNHVVEGANKIDVIFSDGTTRPATVVGTDAYSDLAVIKVNMPQDRLFPVTMGDSNAIKVGDVAIAIGSPFGEQGTMTAGIISAIGRTLPVQNNNTTSSGPTYSIPDVIQTDAPINPGNSGGVLLNDQGQVIGVTSAIESSVNANAGIGFAIPAAIVEKVIPSLIQTGKYEHAYIGISGTSLNPDLAKAMNLNPDQRGALVEDVVSGGPAAKAGLQGSNQQVTINGITTTVGGDVITAINGQPIKTIEDLIAYLADNTQVGQTVTLTILRNGSQMSVDVTLGTRPAENATPVSQNTTNAVWLGVLGIPMDPAIAQTMSLAPDTQGILVEQVEAGSPAAKAGLQAGSNPINLGGQEILVGGDIILAINGNQTSTLSDLQAFLQQANPGEKVTLDILRNGQEMQVEVTLEALPSS
ncbi:MAG: PDZ domain-containing protein [Anaerolineales bacterium]|jgi:serine protease Do